MNWLKKTSALKLVRGPRNLIKTSPNPTTKPNRQILTVFYIYLGPITRLRADFFLISPCDLYGHFEYKKPIFWDNFWGVPPFSTRILTWSPPKLKMNFFNKILQILFYNIPIHNNNTQDKFQVNFCDFHYALPDKPRLQNQFDLTHLTPKSVTPLELVFQGI